MLMSIYIYVSIYILYIVITVIIVIIHIVIILNHRLLASSSHLNIWSTKKSELYFQMIWKCMEKQTLG